MPQSTTTETIHQPKTILFDASTLFCLSASADSSLTVLHYTWIDFLEKENDNVQVLLTYAPFSE